MKHIAGLWENMLAKRTLSMALCLALAVTSGGVCIASTNNLVQETRTAGENGNEGQPESTAETIAQEETKTSAEVSSGTVTMEGEILEEDMKAEEPEDTRCLHEFTATWVGYECKLTDYVDGYEPGDEVRISASFNKPVTSQIGLYIDGVWNSFRGEGKKRNITLVPDSDYLNLQISDLKGQTSVNLTEISVEIIRKGEADTGNYLHKFTGLWQGFETKFSDYNPDYQPGDKIRVTVNYSKYVASQLGMNIGGEWSTLTGEGKELVKEMTPDNDYLNIQITDMWANYKIGILSISVDILQKGPGVSGYGGKGGRLAPTQYKEPGDYLLFSGDANGKYETNDGWILDCADTDWLTLTYSCAPEHENWGILGWGATVNGEWVDGPGYSADSSDSTKEITQNFSLKYLRRMMKITPESDVSYLNLGSYSDGRIEELTLHVGSEIPREDSLFKDGAPNQPWICTDIERILDAPDDMYLCVQYKCAVSDYEGWTVLSWGASVDGEWRNGKSYKVSSREATRNHVFSIRMDAFRNMLHLSWDAKVDSIQLATYNDAQILDIWFSKDKVEDPGDSKKDRGAREGGYSSSNKKTYDDVAKEEGFDYPQNDLTLGPWEWGDIENGEEICQKLKTGSYLIVEYETEDDVEPSLQFIMVDGKQQGVTPTYLTEKREEESERVRENKTKQAIFSYQDIQNFLPDYLIPEEIAYIQISSGDGSMVIKTIRVVTNNTKLEEEPIAVLTSSWSGFSTQLSKWHSDYEVGDTVTVTAAFDKKLPGAIAFNLGGAWNCGSYIDSKIISRTELPDDDYVGIQLGQLPEMSRFAKIMNITVDIAGKPNFNDYVIVTGNRNAGILASTKKEAATAVLSNEEINQGVKVNFVIENGTLSENEAEQIRALFGEQTEDIQIAKVSDITIYKVKEGKQTKVTDTDEPISFKVPVPDEWKNKGYDFSVVREHEGEFTYLEDLDGNPDTVTFASSQFSKFAVVCGEAGVFDGLSGAVKIFRSEWSGWDTSFSKYNEKFKPGKETKVTLTFDKEVKAYVDYHRPEWTRVEGENIGKTFTTTIIPGDDNLGIGIADINGNGIVKLMSLRVEQDAGMVTMFTAKDQKYITTFSAYNEKFVKDYPVTLKLTFDQEVEAGVSYHKTGTMEEIVDFGSTTDKILTKAFTPGDDELRIWLKDMNGNSHIKLIDIEVIQTNVSAIHTFYHTWGQEEDTYSGKISDLCKFEQGDKVRITAIFDKSSSVKMMVTGSDMMLEGTRVSFTATPGTDWFGIQAGDDSKLPLGLLAVTAEVVEKAPPVEGIHRFMAAWSGLETTFSEYKSDFEAGKETTVTLTFDQEVKAQIGYNGANGYINAEGTKVSRTLTKTLTPANDYMNIQIMDMNGHKAVTLITVTVEQKEGEEPVESLHEFTEAWSGFEPKLSDYNAAFEAGKETTVTLTFDKEANAQMAFKTETSGWDTYPGKGKEVTATVVPKEDYINIQITDMAGESAIHLLSVKVEQAGSDANQSSFDDFILGDDPVHVFTEPETFIVDLADYDGEYEAGQGVSIEMNLFSDGNFYVLVEEADGTENVATNSNAKPVAERRMKMAVDKASPSNTGYLDFEGINGYESDEEGSLHIQWEGCPQSGVIAITILEMDGSQVNIDSLEMKEKSGAKSIKNATVQAAKRLATENFSDKNPDSKEKALVPAQEPAKKEEELTENMSDGNMENDETENPNIPKIPEGRREENGDLEDKFSVL